MGRLIVLRLLAALLFVTEVQWTWSKTVPIRAAASGCGSKTATSPSSSSLQLLRISFLPALTENKGRSKHVVGAFQCAVQVSYETVN